MEAYVAKFRELTNEILAIGITILESLLILKFLRGLGRAFSYFQTSFT